MIKKAFSILAAFACLTCTSVFADVNKVAIVDVQKVVSTSPQVLALKKEQETKKAELIKFIENAKADVNKQTDSQKKEELTKKYNKELAAKREANAKAYKTKLEAIDKSITGTITSQAKAMGYDMVLNKSSVLYGGEDITETIIKLVK